MCGNGRHGRQGFGTLVGQMLFLVCLIGAPIAATHPHEAVPPAVPGVR
jgi:hypothetical protein